MTRQPGTNCGLYTGPANPEVLVSQCCPSDDGYLGRRLGLRKRRVRRRTTPARRAALVPAGACKGCPEYPLDASQACSRLGGSTVGSCSSVSVYPVDWSFTSATVLDRAVAASSDDAEENAGTGAMGLASDDLEMVTDTNNVRVGLRFTNMTIPVGATITKAYVQFTADETVGGTGLNLTVKGFAQDNTATFTTAASNIGSRPVTTAAATGWNPPLWTTVGAAGVDQRTPELKTVVQEIVNRPGWASGNAIGLVVTGPGDVRTARSFDFGSGQPVLHVEYTTGAGPAVYTYAKSTAANDWLVGHHVAISADGNTVAVAGRDNYFGSVYVFVYSAGVWTQQAQFPGGGQLGDSLAISDDGNTIAAGGPLNTGYGTTKVWTRSGTTWTLEAELSASTTGAGDYFGSAVALSSNGNTLAVGAWAEDSAATGINGNQADNSANNSGAAYVFTRSGTTWSQQAYIKASNTGAGDFFGGDNASMGVAIALSDDGNTLAVGAKTEDSAATGINGNQADNSANDAGAVYVYTRAGTSWSQQAYVKASDTHEYYGFGFAVAFSGDGNTLVVGSGHQGAYVFTRSGTSWSQQALINGSNTVANDWFGHSVSLSANGNQLAVGAINEDSNATLINGDQSNDLAVDSGAVYQFSRVGSTWTQNKYVKASNTEAGDHFGSGVAVTDSGVLVVGALNEDSNATGINGNQADNSNSDSGAAYIISGGGGSGDTTPPTISSVTASSITSSGATITWTTNEAADTQVEYGTTTSYGSSTTLNTTLVTSHSQPLSGLAASTLYHYRVKSKDAASNLATSGDFTFTTSSSGTIQIGETTILTTPDSGNGDLLLAQPASLGQTATIQSLSFYVTTAAGNLRLGIYDATGPSGGPGAKKAETNSMTPVVGWNTVNVITPVSLPAGTYWLAYLPSSSSLAFRQEYTGTAKFYSYTYGAMPATFSTTHTTNTSHWSFYATLQP